MVSAPVSSAGFAPDPGQRSIPATGSALESWSEVGTGLPAREGNQTRFGTCIRRLLAVKFPAAFGLHGLPAVTHKRCHPPIQAWRLSPAKGATHLLAGARGLSRERTIEWLEKADRVQFECIGKMNRGWFSGIPDRVQVSTAGDGR